MPRRSSRSSRIEERCGSEAREGPYLHYRQRLRSIYTAAESGSSNHNEGPASGISVEVPPLHYSRRIERRADKPERDISAVVGERVELKAL